MHVRVAFALAAATALAASSTASAGVVFGNTGLNGGHRWDAAPRTINFAGGSVERSLAGGLRYSVSGGSWQAYRDSFAWISLPTVAQFQTAVEQAFAAWAAVDPATGLGSDLSFVADFATPVNAASSSGIPLGAEIDLIASNLGDTSTRGVTSFGAIFGTVTLTSGTTGYSAFPLSGADVTLNSNSGARYTLDLFRRLLTHELGHALGLGDVESTISPGNFIDDDYDPADPVGTLNNSWAHLVDPFDPSASPLSVYTIARPGDPTGVATTGIDILMESNGLGVAAGNPITKLVPLSNDDFGIRQFLYPFVADAPFVEGDADGDGDVDFDDLGLLLGNYGFNTTPAQLDHASLNTAIATAEASLNITIPEPSAAALLAPAVLVLFRRQRR